MKNFVFASLLLAAVVTPLSSVPAAQVTLGAIRDNTIYGDTFASSNGVGDHFVAGKAGSATSLRRGLIAFHLPQLPVGTRVDRAALELVFQGTTNQETLPREVSVHRLLANWGEGDSNAGPGGAAGSGNGTPASVGDATWRYRFFETQTWSSYSPSVAGSGGGDFVSQPSALSTVGIDPDVLVRWETIRSEPASGMVADVEQWLADPSSNFGWLLKTADESTLRTARRFYSKDSPNAAFHPRLVIDYTVVPEPAGLALLAIGGLMALRGIRAKRSH